MSAENPPTPEERYAAYDASFRAGIFTPGEARRLLDADADADRQELANPHLPEKITIDPLQQSPPRDPCITWKNIPASAIDECGMDMETFRKQAIEIGQRSVALRYPRKLSLFHRIAKLFYHPTAKAVVFILGYQGAVNQAPSDEDRNGNLHGLSVRAALGHHSDEGLQSMVSHAAQNWSQDASGQDKKEGRI